MAPKKAKDPPLISRVEVRKTLIQIGTFICQLFCNFCLLVVRCTGEGLHALLQVVFKMILDVLRILLMLIARVLSDICYGAAFILEKILAAFLQLLLQFVLRVGRFVNQTAQGLVNQAGYGISSAIFIAITVFLCWLIVAIFQDFSHAFELYMIERTRQPEWGEGGRGSPSPLLP